MSDSDDYDNPWKEAIEGAFPEFMAFFFPAAAERIDWGRGYEFLDQELRQVVRDADSGKRYVDKLARVFLKNGEEDWVYIHVEVQGSDEAAFPERMFTYHYRLFDRYRRPIASFAVLADTAPNWRPGAYTHELLGCRVDFVFPSVKLLDLRPGLDELLDNANPFAWVSAAHLLTQDTKGDTDRRYAAKRRLVRLLYQRGWERQRVINLFAVLDWMMRLPKALEQRLWQEIEAIEEEQRMRYVTSVERFYDEKWMNIHKNFYEQEGQKRLQESRQEGRQEGRQVGRQEGRQEGEAGLLRKLLTRRFGELPTWAEARIAAAGVDELEGWAELLLTAPSLEAVLGEPGAGGH
jgi:hypothetical protein